MQVIIYEQDGGGVAVIYPTQSALDAFGINAIAKKDVPQGKPYKILDSEELPRTRAARNAWSVNRADLTDGIGGAGNTFDGGA